MGDSKKLWGSQLLLLSALFISMFIIFKIVLFDESVLTLLLVLLGLFYSIVLPGVVLLAYLDKKLNFAFRLVLGSVLSLAITGILSYYLGLVGVHIKYHPYIIPPLIILAGVFLFFREGQHSQNL